MTGRLVVLGCDGSYPSAGGATSGYLLEVEGQRIWIDAGSGSFARLQCHIDPASLDAVVLTHEHPDHWSDIDAFSVWAELLNPDRTIAVLAPPGLAQRTYHAARSARCAFITVDDGDEIELGSVTLSFSATVHGPRTLAVMVAPAQGSTFAYSADTGPGWSFAAFDRPVGLGLCEASFLRHDEGRFHHLSGRQAGSMSAEADVGNLVVTHRWPTVSAEKLADEASAAFGRPVEQAEAGKEWSW